MQRQKKAAANEAAAAPATDAVMPTPGVNGNHPEATPRTAAPPPRKANGLLRNGAELEEATPHTNFARIDFQAPPPPPLLPPMEPTWQASYSQQAQQQAPAASAPSVADEVDALRRYANVQARLEAELSREVATRSALEETVSRLEGELSAIRQEQVLQSEGDKNLGYLKHVLLALLEGKEGQDEGPLLQVVFTFLQFSPVEVARVSTARASVADRRRTLSSRLSLW